MSFHSIFVLVGLIFQIILTVAVVNDARSRGADSLIWGALTILFGLFAALIYIISRPDEKLPEEEQPEKVYISVLVLYLGLMFAGLIFGLFFYAFVDMIVFWDLSTGFFELSAIFFSVIFPLLLFYFKNRD